MNEPEPLKPRITVWYDGQNPNCPEAKSVEIHWDGRLSVKRVYTSEEELAREDKRGRTFLQAQTARNTYNFKHISKEDEQVENWP